MARIVLKRGNDQVVTLTGLRTTDPTPIYLNAATVKATLCDSKGQPLPDFSDVVMPYVDGSEGNYEWAIEADAMMLPKSTEYSLILTAQQDELDYRAVHAVSVVDG
jgi:hypothetical protein